jgi:hypothetical protein
MLTLARPRSAAHDVFVPDAGGPTVNLGDFNKLAGNFGLAAAGAVVTSGDWAALASAARARGRRRAAAQCRRPPREPAPPQRVIVQTLVV